MEYFFGYVQAVLFDNSGNLKLSGKLIFSFLVLLIAFTLSVFAKKLLKRARRIGKIAEKSKAKTIYTMIDSLIEFSIFFIATILILDKFGLNTASIIATAGIGGVALGFGAQYIIRDVISGAAILMEDQYNVGDLVTIAGKTGHVEAVGLRLTKLRDFNGDLHIIQNGTVQMVTNSSRGSQRALVEVYVPNKYDFREIKQIIDQALDKVSSEYPGLTEKPHILGITNMGKFFMTITVIGMISGERHWELERKIREEILLNFNNHGIKFIKEVPFGGTDEI